MFAGKRSRKSLDNIQMRMCSPMLRQAQNISYFKPAGQPNPTSANSLKFNDFTSSPCSALRSYLPANQRSVRPQVLASIQAFHQALRALDLTVLCGGELCGFTPNIHLDRSSSPIHWTADLSIAGLLAGLHQYLPSLIILIPAPFPDQPDDCGMLAPMLYAKGP